MMRHFSKQWLMIESRGRHVAGSFTDDCTEIWYCNPAKDVAK